MTILTPTYWLDQLWFDDRLDESFPHGLQLFPVDPAHTVAVHGVLPGIIGPRGFNISKIRYSIVTLDEAYSSRVMTFEHSFHRPVRIKFTHYSVRLADGDSNITTPYAFTLTGTIKTLGLKRLFRWFDQDEVLDYSTVKIPPVMQFTA